MLIKMRGCWRRVSTILSLQTFQFHKVSLENSRDSNLNFWTFFFKTSCKIFEYDVHSNYSCNFKGGTNKFKPFNSWHHLYPHAPETVQYYDRHCVQRRDRTRYFPLNPRFVLIWRCKGYLTEVLGWVCLFMSSLCGLAVVCPSLLMTITHVTWRHDKRAPKWVTACLGG